MAIETKEYLEEALKQIWGDNSFKFIVKDRKFLYPQRLETDALLFIGINPSYPNQTSQFTSYILNKENNGIPYFDKFSDLAKECGVNWTHLDLLFFQETAQDYVHKILNMENGVSFIWKQLQLTDKLLRMANPKVIVVSNALAGVFLGKEKDILMGKNLWLNYEFIFDEEIGTYRWNNIPIFFCSMLTGQRALDKGSYERLTWQIKRTLIIDSSSGKQVAINVV